MFLLPDYNVSVIMKQTYSLGRNDLVPDLTVNSTFDDSSCFYS